MKPCLSVMILLVGGLALTPPAFGARRVDPKIRAAAKRGLEYLAREQRRQGYWEGN